MGQLDQVWRQNRLSLATKLRIYTTCVLAVGLHGAETWTLLKEDSHRLQAFHMTCQRRILGIRWNDFITNKAVADSTNLPSILSTIVTSSSAIFVVCLTTHQHVRLWIPCPETHHTMIGIAQLADHGLHGWVRSCGTPDSLLLTHGLSLTTGQHGGRYDPQPVTRSSEWVSLSSSLSLHPHELVNDIIFLLNMPKHINVPLSITNWLNTMLITA